MKKQICLFSAVCMIVAIKTQSVCLHKILQYVKLKQAFRKYSCKR